MKAEIRPLNLATWKSLVTDEGKFGEVIESIAWFKRDQENVSREIDSGQYTQGSQEIWEV